MKIIINNEAIIIQNPTDTLASVLEETLVYTDKSKQYQLKKLSKTRWGLNSPLYKKLKQEVDGKLFIKHPDGSYEISSCFYYLIQSYLDHNSIDNRKDTGKTLSLPWVNKLPDLRSYQEEAVGLMESNRRGLINLATGLGKTMIALHFIRRYKKKTLILCPSDSVAQQFYEQLCHCFGKNKIGFFGGGKKKINDITVGIAASVIRNIGDFKKADLGLVLIDETHHTPATTFYEVAVGLNYVGKIFGLTATDYRSDGKDIMITGGCGPVLIRRDAKWGVENKWLADPYFVIREVKTGGRDIKDDKLKSYKEHILNNQIMKDIILSDARKALSTNKSLLILVDEVAHGEELSKQLGIPFATGKDPRSQDYVDALNNGKIPGLVGTDGKISEGTDTRNVDVLLLCNFVASRGPVMQCVGRALRKTPTKDKVLIIDYNPVDSTMLSRHAKQRISFYRDITRNIVIKSAT